MNESAPKPRPRAIRLDAAGHAEPAAKILEPEFDSFELEAQKTLLAPEAAEAAVELAQTKGILRRSFFSWGGIFWSSLFGLISLAFGLWLTSLFEGLFARAPALGFAGLLLASLAALALLILGTREIAAIARQRHITNLHMEFAKARAADDRNSARKLIRELSSLYTTRPETAQARAHLGDLTQEIVDGRDLIDIAERTLIEPIDAKVRAGIASAARRVSMVTALAPRAVIDVLFVAAQSIYLIRLISMLYGGRPGVFGFLKLLRSVGTHIAITGGMAATDTILQQVIGHGIAAKLSAKLGEGVLNGLLTARVGLSAMAVCRPLPFGDGKAPSLGDVAPFLFRAEKTQAKE